MFLHHEAKVPEGSEEKVEHDTACARTVCDLIADFAASAESTGMNVECWPWRKWHGASLQLMQPALREMGKGGYDNCMCTQKVGINNAVTSPIKV